MFIDSKNMATFGVTVAMLVAGFANVPAYSADRTSGQSDSSAVTKEIDRLKNENEFEKKRVEDMRAEREQFVKEIRRMENLNNKYTNEINTLKAQIGNQEKNFESRLDQIESQVKGTVSSNQKTEDIADAVSTKLAVDVEKEANEVFMKGGDIDPEDQKFKEELARAHYNMGNVYYERGEYQRAVVEYYQAVDLMPYDADAHYNLAFVSGEYVGDQETALKHYQWYLYLKPAAEDRKLIEEKIVASKISLRSRLNSKADVSELTGHTNVSR